MNSAGGDRRSGRIEAQAGFILGLVETTPDMTLAEIRSDLVGKGVGSDMATLWRFFDRRKITQKKTAHATDAEAAGDPGPWRPCIP